MSLRAKITEFFLANPEDTLTPEDVALKYSPANDVSRVRDVLLAMTITGELSRTRATTHASFEYHPGPNLGLSADRPSWRFNPVTGQPIRGES